MRSKGAIHGVHPDPVMRDESESHGMARMIPYLNRLAQAHERYDAWLATAIAKADAEGRYVDFDEERYDRLEALAFFTDELVRAWVKARGVNPQHR